MIDISAAYLEQEDPECVDLPSRQEIDELCQEIRSEWSEREYHKRSNCFPSRWVAPSVNLALDFNYHLEE